MLTDGMAAIAPLAGSELYDLKLFPEEPVELMVGEALVLNCTATAEFNAGVDLQWQYPRQQVQAHHTGDRRAWGVWDSGTLEKGSILGGGG